MIIGGHHVYLLFCKDYEIFKIGETQGIHTRVKKLSKFLKYKTECIFVFTFERYSEAIKLEKILHKKFKKHNVPKINLPKFPGYTEFYDNVIFQDLMFFILNSDFVYEFKIVNCRL